MMQTPHLACCPFLGLTLPSFKRKNKSKSKPEESTPSSAVFADISTYAEETSDTEQTRRITVEEYITIAKCSFIITVSPSLGYGFQTCVPVSMIKGLPMLFSGLGSWLNFSQCNQISNTKGMPRKTQTKAFNLQKPSLLGSAQFYYKLLFYLLCWI